MAHMGFDEVFVHINITVLAGNCCQDVMYTMSKIGFMANFKPNKSLKARLLINGFGCFALILPGEQNVGHGHVCFTFVALIAVFTAKYLPLHIYAYLYIL